jgi:chitodextrinase
MNFTTPYNTSDYFFTKEQDYIQFNSALVNTYFEIQVVITTYDFYTEAQNTKALLYRIPLFQNRASFLLGEIIDRSMPRMQGINLRSLFQYKATDVELTIKEIDYATDTDISTNVIGPVKFVSGFVPEVVQNNCAFLDIYDIGRRVTPTGFAFINMILTPGVHNFKLFKNNLQVDSFDISIISSNICSRALKLNNFGATEGDIFECIMTANPNVTKTFYVFPSSLYSNYIAFEDEYRLKTVMEFTGEYKFSGDFITKTNKIQKGSVEFNRKISSRTDVVLNINTGFLLQEEELIVESLLGSLRAWLIVGENQGIELVPTSKKIAKQDPTTALYSYDIDFMVNPANLKPLRIAMNQPLVIIEVDDIAPTAPLNLTATNRTTTTLLLSWSNSNDAAGVVGYDIFRDGVYLNSTPNLSFIPTELTPGTSYNFYVKAKDAAGNRSLSSNEVTVSTLSNADTIPPTQPTNLVAVDIFGTNLRLQWSASTDNIGVAKYNIYRDGVKIGEVIAYNSPVLEFNVNGLNPFSIYTFQVTAQDAAGNISLYSNTAQALTGATSGGRIQMFDHYITPCDDIFRNLWFDPSNNKYHVSASGDTLFNGTTYTYVGQDSEIGYEWSKWRISNGNESPAGIVFSPCAPF